jgi:alkylation response protein AidB-like acyl-CoA dehydrogenase
MDAKTSATSSDAKIDYVTRAREIAPLIAAAAPHMEARRQLTDDVLELLHDADLFRLVLPKRFGGPEVDLVTFMEVIETIAAADASVAWCLGQSAGCVSAAAYLDADVARTIFGDPKSLLAWGPVIKNTHVANVDGGYRVSGTAQFLSGLHHARWVGMRAMLLDRDGKPEGARTFLFEREHARILDVWQVEGLRATGSDSIQVEDLFVPASHTFLMDAVSDRRETGTLYRFTTNIIFAVGFACVALGLARTSLDAFADLAGRKAAQYWPGLMRESALVQNQYAVAEANLRAARTYLYQSMRDAWASAEQGGIDPTRDHKIDLRLAGTHAIHAAKEVVDFAYQSAGASAIFAANPFERRFRDMHAVSQQIQASAAQFTNMGQILLGITPQNPRTI